MGTLYIVATPIGNLEDITLRALRVLREVELIAAEDTRRTRKLLRHYDIHTPLTSYYEHNKLTKLDEILAVLQKSDVAVVSEAGTPGISDPGYELVRAAIAVGAPVTPVPGPSAAIAALSVAGLPTDQFIYVGFLPRRQSDRRLALASVLSEKRTVVAFEAPHRLATALSDVRAILGQRQVVVCRELTKIHEELFRGEVDEAIRHFSASPLRGECTLIIAGASRRPPMAEAEVREMLRGFLTAGVRPGEVAALVAEASGWSRRDVYRLLLDIRRCGNIDDA